VGASCSLLQYREQDAPTPEFDCHNDLDSFYQSLSNHAYESSPITETAPNPGPDRNFTPPLDREKTPLKLNVQLRGPIVRQSPEYQERMGKQSHVSLPGQA